MARRHRAHARRRNPESQAADLGRLATVTALVGAAAANWFSVFSPSTYEVKVDLAENPEQTRRLLRASYVPAAGWGLGLAAVVSVAERSVLPLFVGAATAALMIRTYEHTLPASERLGVVGAVLAGFQTPDPFAERRAIALDDQRVHILPYPYPEAG